jgi:hypothetical protein
MNSPRGSTPRNPTPDLQNRSTDLCKTLGIIGTEEESKKSCQELLYPYNTENPEIELLNSWIWEGNQREKDHEGFTHTSRTKSPRAMSQKRTKKSTKRGLRKSPPEQTGTTQPSLEEPRRIIHTYQRGSYMV